MVQWFKILMAAFRDGCLHDRSVRTRCLWCLAFLLTLGVVLAVGQPPAEVVEPAAQASENGADFIAVFDRGLPLALAAVFLLGLALNLTPCVYPMLAVTVSIFGGQSERRNGLAFGKAAVYVLGIAAMYSLLGVVAAMTGGLFGVLMQSRFVLIGISLMFFALALSMFGLYEFQLPAGLMSRLGGTQTAGLAGTFVSGLLVGVFAAPCIGPPIIGLLILVGQRGDLWFGFLVFFVMSLGLGLPYLVLGSFSGLLQKLPRSGEWMIWFRKLLGLVLTGVAFFYLSLAYRPSLVFVLIPLTLVAGGFYLGFLERSHTAGKGFLIFKRLLGMAAVAAGCLFFMQGRKPSLEWKPYSSAALEGAGRPAVIYFSADWCIPCLEMDRFTFTDSDVMRALGGFVCFKADMTHSRSEEVAAIRDRYGIRGVPTLVFLDAGGMEVTNTRRTESLSAPELLGHLKRVQRRLADGSAPDDAELAAPGALDDPSTVRLIADVEWIQPGRPFRIGVLFRMRDSWHVYWKNPGDSGIPPMIAWQWPEGYAAEARPWPYPQLFEDPAGITYGHERELLLIWTVNAPFGRPASEMATFSAEVDWLVCKEICIAQDDRVSLRIPVREATPPPSAEWNSAFERFEARMPVSKDGWKFQAFRAAPARYRFSVVSPPVKPETMMAAEFFPSQIGFISAGRYRWLRTGDSFELLLQAEGAEPDEARLRGVLVLPQKEPGAGRKAIFVDTAIAMED